MSGFFNKASAHLNMKGQGQGVSSEGNSSERNIYPALVVNTKDPANQNRLVARIVSVNDQGEISGGKDRDKADSDLPFCNPLMSEFLHVRPIEGEMVIVVLENPSDNSAARYWIGPVITTQLKLNFQSYKDALDSFNYTDFYENINPQTDPNSFEVFPDQSDIALQGRDDSDLILKSKEANLVAGKFEPDSLRPNVTSPCRIQIKQIEEQEDEDGNEIYPRYSRININATNINIWSTNGKFRDESTGERLEPSNQDLQHLDALSKTLHPAVFGDNLIELLDLMIRILLNHVHHPQTKLLETEDSNRLAEYSIEGRLQELLSKFVRMN